MFRILTTIGIFIILNLTFFINQSHSKLYKWTDDEGKTRFTNELYVVPEQYKKQTIEVDPITRQPIIKTTPTYQPPILQQNPKKQIEKTPQNTLKQIPKPQIINPPTIKDKDLKDLEIQAKTAVLKAGTGIIFLISVGILISIGILILVIKFIVYRVYKEKTKYETKKQKIKNDTNFKF